MPAYDPVPSGSVTPFTTEPQLFVTAADIPDGGNTGIVSNPVNNNAVSGAGALSGTTNSGGGLGSATMYTTPAGKTLTISSFVISGSISAGTAFNFQFESPSGTVIASGTGTTGAGNLPQTLSGPFSPVPTGQAVIFRVPLQTPGATCSTSATMYGTVS